MEKTQTIDFKIKINLFLQQIICYLSINNW